VDTIAFNVTGAGCDGSGVCTIVTGGLPQLTTALTIDGYSQAGAAVNTLAQGSNAKLKIVLASAGSGTALFVNATDVTIRGLVINGGFSRGIETLGGSVDVGAKVTGCFIGTDTTGLLPSFNTRGLNVSGANWQIGGSAAADRNVIAASDTAVFLNPITDSAVQGNLIGIKANGTERFSPAGATTGLAVAQSNGSILVGGSAPGAGNLIGGFLTGVFVNTALGGTITIHGNRIGTDSAGAIHLGNGRTGLMVDASDVIIGGAGAGEGNIIAFNGDAGVQVGPFSNGAHGVRIRGNSIHDNAQNVPPPASDLGIDLVIHDVNGAHYGVTANDPGDPDLGANGLQNYPLVNAVSASSVQGTLNSESSTLYTLDFYASTNCGTSGYGESEIYLGSTQVTTDGSGDASFNYSVSVPSGKKVTATATAPDGSTSEFSRCADLLPRYLEADTQAGATSDGNGVFEPGETGTVRPNWENPTELSLAATSTASALAGPAGASYSTVDSSSDYGQILKKTIGSCSTTFNCFTMFVSAPATRPAAHWDANFVETMSTREGAKPWKLHLGDSFQDVPRSQLFYKKIEAVFHNAITVGCDPTHYCPDDSVPRDQMAIFLARAIAHGGANVPASGSVGGKPYNCIAGGVSLYTDVPPTSIACKSIHYIAAQNVTTGCSPNLYCPTQLVTRAQMAIFVAKGIVAPAGGAGIPLVYTQPAPPHLSYSCDAAGTPHSYFTDVTPADAFCKHVNYLYLSNVVAGCSASQYCPNGNVTRGEMSKFLSNAFSLLLYGP
jgi:hypothetical protein